MTIAEKLPNSEHSTFISQQKYRLKMADGICSIFNNTSPIGAIKKIRIVEIFENA